MHDLKTSADVKPYSTPNVPVKLNRTISVKGNSDTNNRAATYNQISEKPDERRS